MPAQDKQTYLTPLSIETFYCPITQQLYFDPWITQSGHTYEKEALDTLIHTQKTDPITREPITSMSPNIILRGLIESFLDANPEMRTEQYQPTHAPSTTRESLVTPQNTTPPIAQTSHVSTFYSHRRRAHTQSIASRPDIHAQASDPNTLFEFMLIGDPEKSYLIHRLTQRANMYSLFTETLLTINHTPTRLKIWDILPELSRRPRFAHDFIMRYAHTAIICINLSARESHQRTLEYYAQCPPSLTKYVIGYTMPHRDELSQAVITAQNLELSVFCQAHDIHYLPINLHEAIDIVDRNIKQSFVWIGRNLMDSFINTPEDHRAQSPSL